MRGATPCCTGPAQAEQLSQHAETVSQLEAQVGSLQDRLRELTRENEAVAADVEAKTQSLRMAEGAVVAQQAKLAEQQRQAEEWAAAHDKVALFCSWLP